MTAARKLRRAEPEVVTYLHVATLGTTTRTRHKLRSRTVQRDLCPADVEALPPARSLRDSPWCAITDANGVTHFVVLKRTRSGLVLDIVSVQGEPEKPLSG